MFALRAVPSQKSMAKALCFELGVIKICQLQRTISGVPQSLGFGCRNRWCVEIMERLRQEGIWIPQFQFSIHGVKYGRRGSAKKLNCPTEAKARVWDKVTKMAHGESMVDMSQCFLHVITLASSCHVWPPGSPVTPLATRLPSNPVYPPGSPVTGCYRSSRVTGGRKHKLR